MKNKLVYTTSYNSSYTFTRGDIYYVELSNEYHYCLQGLHPCLIVDQTMQNVRIIPFTSIKEYSKIYNNERLVTASSSTGLTKDSKLIYRQFTTVSTEKFKSRCGKLD